MKKAFIVCVALVLLGLTAGGAFAEEHYLKGTITTVKGGSFKVKEFLNVGFMDFRFMAGGVERSMPVREMQWIESLGNEKVRVKARGKRAVSGFVNDADPGAAIKALLVPPTTDVVVQFHDRSRGVSNEGRIPVGQVKRITFAKLDKNYSR